MSEGFLNTTGMVVSIACCLKINVFEKHVFIIYNNSVYKIIWLYKQIEIDYLKYL